MTNQATDTGSLRRIRIDNLPPGTTEPTLRALFLRHGRVTGYERPADPVTRRPGPIAYVQMSPLDATDAIEALQGHHLAGHALRIDVAPSEDAATPAAATQDRGGIA
jgi:RNA recognition motif-containing protein